MDRTEARALLESQLDTYRKRTYSDLLTLMGDVSVLQVVGESGTEYQIEIDVFWDDPGKKTNLRVMGAIDDGRLPGALLPSCESFLVAPDGSFVGE